ncbi:hypothetical protein CKO15_08280 [Halorhodospira abdelmalekii]|uniref:chorismate--pyruvate lyase family protein n=1 Tax=Halorhodospira abdelmalekii TaxID=421629 RepID=UPI00190315D6|nr:chorismate lyase [Halorhodospira abdelmalekii]MBK1735283.1 hypothetical protein [Halorhodospira abdelmalekii]
MERWRAQQLVWRPREAAWRPGAAPLPGRPPPLVRALLAVRDSLTQRLERIGPVQVELLWQGVARASLDEARALGIGPRRRVWLREVILACEGGPRVYARSVLPGRACGRLAGLRRLGARPLGRLIFAAADVQRSPLAVARLRGPEPLARRLAAYGECGTVGAWARRSTILAAHQSILVTEVFLTGTVSSEEVERDRASTARR